MDSAPSVRVHPPLNTVARRLGEMTAEQTRVDSTGDVLRVVVNGGIYAPTTEHLGEPHVRLQHFWTLRNSFHGG
jgi:hypothetical protein